jgi:hypothetical protein
MSYFLTVYTLNLDETRGLIGSGSDVLMYEISWRFRQWFEREDADHADAIADGAPTGLEAVRAVFDGGPFNAKYPHLYALAYKRICQDVGHEEPANSFAPFKHRWLAAVDEGLAQLGVTAVAVSDLALGLPDGVPYSDVLSYGEWSQAQCQEGLAQWNATTEEQRHALDRSILAAVTECAAWMESALAFEKLGVVGFMS